MMGAQLNEIGEGSTKYIIRYPALKLNNFPRGQASPEG
jgi:hypothetical protein